MPTRIKPEHELGPCVLTLESIKGIAELIGTNFQTSLYSAHDGVWEVYDEPREKFLQEVEQRNTLDSFRVEARGEINCTQRQIDLKFNESEAVLICAAHPTQQNWFEHFLIDFNKYVLPPTFSQKFAHSYLTPSSISLPFGAFLALSTFSVDLAFPGRVPYCKIVIKKRPPNPFMQNVKAGLISSAIITIIALAVGFAVGKLL